MGKLQDWSNENSMEKKVLAQLAKRCAEWPNAIPAACRSCSMNARKDMPCCTAPQTVSLMLLLLPILQGGSRGRAY